MGEGTGEGRAKQQTDGTTPRIYVASLVDYNAGRLTGVWLDAVDAHEARAGIEAMLTKARCPGAEVAIHDFEGFGSYPVHEFDGIDFVCALGAAIAELGEQGEVFGDWLAHVGEPKDADDVALQVERFRESYQGSFSSLEDWAEQFLEDTGALKAVPESLRPYIDYEAWARDAELNGDVFAIERDGEVHLFWRR